MIGTPSPFGAHERPLAMNDETDTLTPMADTLAERPTRSVDSMNRTEYTALIDTFIEHGYRFTNFFDFEETGCLLLRHDIDFSVDLALEMARYEGAKNLSATYFVLLSSSFYNVRNAKVRAQIREIRDLGHQIGLHFDPSIYEDIDAGFASEKLTFEEVFGTELRITSLHRPRSFLDRNKRLLKGSQHTYEDTYFKDILYISDSGARFRFDHPTSGPHFEEKRTIHLLIHPIWWMTDAGTASEKLREWQRTQFRLVNEETINNCKFFDGEIAK